MKQEPEKRSVQVNVRMTKADSKLLDQAAGKLWPAAEMSKSSVVLSLAKLAAKTALGTKDRPRRRSRGSEK
jgi:uncharacterized protein (DUF1778 family)